MAAMREVMTRHPITIDPNPSLSTAAVVMRGRCVRHLPVVDNCGRLVGIVTDALYMAGCRLSAATPMSTCHDRRAT